MWESKGRIASVDILERRKMMGFCAQVEKLALGADSSSVER